MFGKNHLSLIALATTATAVKIQREPLLSNNKRLEVFQKEVYADHPVDYKVADYGMDHEIQYSLNNTKNTETKLKHKLNFFNEPVPAVEDNHPMDYKVADFGMDPEIATSLSNMVGAESSLNHKFGVTKDSVFDNAPNWSYLQTGNELNREPLLSANRALEVHQKAAYSDYPVDYVVPDFGIDHEIKYSLNNTKNTETAMKHKLNFMNDPVPLAEDSHPMNYAVPDFGVDEDVKFTQKNLGNAESKLGVKMASSFGQTSGEPRNYVVPDFGVSDEIIYTQNNIKNSEKQFGRKLNVAWDANANGDDVRGYKVPDFGMDIDIKNSLANLDLEQGIHGRWNLDGFAEPKATKAEQDGKKAKPSTQVVDEKNAEEESSAANADAEIKKIPTVDNTSETNEIIKPSPPVSASDLEDAIQAAPMSADELAKSVNNGRNVKKGKGKTKLSKEEKADRKAKNDGAANEDNDILAKKLAEQVAERKAKHAAKKAEAKAAKDAADNKKAAELEKYNEISGATKTPEASMGAMSFVQMNSPKDSEAPTNQSLVKPQNWDKVAHTWF